MPSTPAQEQVGALRLEFFGLDPLDEHAGRMGETGVIEGLVNRLVRVAVIDVFADDGDRHLLLRMADPLHRDPASRPSRNGPADSPSFCDDQLVQAVLGQPQRHFVDREFLVHLLDDGLRFDVAKQRDLLAVFAAQRPLGAHDQDVGLDTDLPQLADAVLRRLGLGLAGRLEIGHQREVHEQAILLADVERNLPDGFEERQPLDVADRAAQLGDHDVDAGPARLRTAALISSVTCGTTWTVRPRYSPRRSFSITRR